MTLTNRISSCFPSWAPSSYITWSYNPYRWRYKEVTGVIATRSGVIYFDLVGAAFAGKAITHLEADLGDDG